MLFPTSSSIAGDLHLVFAFGKDLENLALQSGHVETLSTSARASLRARLWAKLV